MTDGAPSLSPSPGSFPPAVGAGAAAPLSPPRPFLSPAQEARLRELAGVVPMRVIVAALGLSDVALYRHGRRLGVRFGYRHPDRLTPALAAAVRARAGAMTQAAIGAELGVDKTTVRSWLRRLGLPTRRAGPRPGRPPDARQRAVLAASPRPAILNALATRLGVSHNLARRWADEIGLTLAATRATGIPRGPTPRTSPAIKAKVRAMAGRASAAAIAEAIGKSIRATHMIAARMDVARPRPPKAPADGSVPAWVPADLRQDYRDFAREYGEEIAASKVRALKREAALAAGVVSLNSPQRGERERRA